MLPTDLPAQHAFRMEARDWIQRNAPWPLLPKIRGMRFAGQPFDSEHEWLAVARDWQRRKYEAGWACLVWPREFGGRGMGPSENVIFQEEEGVFAELFGPFMIGQGFVAPTLMAYASAADQRRFLPALASGEAIWCQMFSEPAAGSDLAGVRLRATPCEGGWRLNGQKVWTSGAHHSAYGIVLTRSDLDVPKHKGMTMFWVDMASPGLQTRPIRQLSGVSHFNEVFFDDVFVPDAQRLGTVGGGWQVALTTLSNERMTLGASTPVGFDEIFELARQPGADGHAPIESDAVRERLADWYTKVCGMRYGVYRILSTLEQGGQPGAEVAVGKLVGASTTQDIAAFGLDLLGASGRSAGIDDAVSRFHSMFCFGAIHRLEGGTDEVLRNILAERALGLPAEPRSDRGAFRDIPTAPGA
ncbi:acyl-CoA dehydrogenase family protein [Aquabacterium sp.]|uniref:acyl-CoA dehydrogenase family protein n=1 Tax=Aquabacterium sp. TaxID=1872578 RepID=UPI002BF35068|nr:acyl-CoA dehydrogenase family protein [Aquabacterium sp.]HSW04942.1 acyl-CoA dehydrogenase family protein [Aquabacterium sp.]